MITDIRLLDYGIFDASDSHVAKVFDLQSPKEYFFDVFPGIHLKKLSEKIPLEQGISFGIRFRIESAPPGPVPFLIRVIHPEMENPDNNFTFTETSRSKNLEANAVHTEIYTLENKWEMIPGFWSFQVEHNSTILLAKEFELYVSETFNEEEEEVFFYDM